MNLKKIYKLSSELRESLASIARSEANIPAIEVEMTEHFESLVDKVPSKGQEILLSRKKKNFQERLNRERDNIATSQIEVSVLQTALEKEGAAVIAEIQAALAADHGHQATVCDELKKEIARLKFKTNELEKQYQAEDLLKENKRLLVRDFRRTWNPEMIVDLIVSPENADEKAGRIIQFLPDSVQSAWQHAQNKKNKQQQQEREQAERKHQEQIALNRGFVNQALEIIKKRLPLPVELQTLYNHTSIELNVLSDFLRRKWEANQSVDKQHGKSS